MTQRNKLLRLILQLVLSLTGLTILVIIDWRIAVAVFFMVWASNMQASDRIIDILEKLFKQPK